MRRDPRRYPVGLVTGRPDEADSEVLQWFRHAGEMTAFLWRMEPQRWGLRLAQLAELKTRAEPVIVHMAVSGPTEELRQAHNEISRPHFEIRWWGSFDELRTGHGAWAQSFLRGIDAADEDALLAALRTRASDRREQ